MLKDSQLKKSLFPVGILTKKEVREIALLNALPVSSKKDSCIVVFCSIAYISKQAFVNASHRVRAYALPKWFSVEFSGNYHADGFCLAVVA